MAITGAGKTIWYDPSKTTGTGLGKVKHLQNSAISISAESEEFEALGLPWSPGVITTLASGETSFTMSGEMSFQKIGLTELEVLFNTQAEDVSSITVPVPFQTTITSDTATVTGLTVDQAVSVSISTEGKQQNLTQIASAGTPAAGEYDVTADTITFNTSEFADGTLITGTYFAAVTTGKMIGGNSTSSQLGVGSFYGDLVSTEYTNPIKLWIPKITFSRNLSIDLLASGEDVTASFTISTDSENGMNFPIALIFPTS